jgi:hypothetical protein
VRTGAELSGDAGEGIFVNDNPIPIYGITIAI